MQMLSTLALVEVSFPQPPRWRWPREERWPSEEPRGRSGRRDFELSSEGHLRFLPRLSRYPF